MIINSFTLDPTERTIRIGNNPTDTRTVPLLGWAVEGEYEDELYIQPVALIDRAAVTRSEYARDFDLKPWTVLP